MCLIIIIDNLCIALFSGVHKLTAQTNVLRHWFSKKIKKKKNLSKMFTKVIHI